MRGKFITLEGIDGAGKSSHLAWLVEALRARGLTVVSTREPGGTPLGEKLRTLLLNDAMHPDTEALLMFAARREHMTQLIQPALDSGAWVVSDRFTDASYAYQGGGRNLGAERLGQLENWVLGSFQPTLTFLFDTPVEVAAQRLAGNGEARDRFEQERTEFVVRVREAYLARAAAQPERIRIIDARASIEEIRVQLSHHLTQLFS